eukprot:CAMPEP_0171657372 /NCGR_PEP_ID=MMETSP0990-20121206/42211_1 /TAXON_ID=483369 /ORGANISM="non described non described, Strain CCMP2098" /LENGTH=32 /DNA_ID= /DNA_START= /DNA_END= /DNA_ORIENTATION=
MSTSTKLKEPWVATLRIPSSRATLALSLAHAV